MKYLLKNIDICGYELEEYPIKDKTFFGLSVYFTIESHEGEGGSDYQVFVCTPKWIEKEVKWRRSMWGKNLLIVDVFDKDIILNAIFGVIHELSKCEKFEEKMAQYAQWEFENYSNLHK